MFETAVARSGILLGNDTERSIDRHANIAVTSALGVTFEMLWDPYINSSLWNYIEEAQTDNQKRAALVYIKAGYWDIKNSGPTGLERWSHEVNRIADFVGKHGVESLTTGHVVVSFLHPTVEEALSNSRKSITNALTEAYNRHLYRAFVPDSPANRWGDSLEPALSRFSRVLLPFAALEMHRSAPELTLDGLHYQSVIQDAELDVIFNRICNAKLESRHPPFRSSCCVTYPKPGWKSAVWMIALVALGPAIFLLRWALANSNASKVLPATPITRAISVLSLAVLVCFVTDRTGLFQKENKEFSSIAFGATLGGIFLCGWATARSGKDYSFLNRDQTDEWKGWMQL
ncbi:hypothetical protein HDU93_008956, partial [Gonapodya sp. JEL0774]